MLSQALSYAPNVNVAVLSAGRLLRLMDRVPQYNNPENTVQRESQVKNNNSLTMGNFFLQYMSSKTDQEWKCEILKVGIQLSDTKRLSNHERIRSKCACW